MAESQLVEQVTFITAAGVRDRLVVACIPDEMAEQKKDVAFLLEWRDGTWISADHALMDSAVAMAADPEHDLVLTLGFWGDVYCLQGGLGHLEPIPGAGGKVGPMRGLAFVEDRFYAVGMGREAFVRSPAGGWNSISSGTRVDEPKLDAEGFPHPEGFEAVDGFSNTEVYAVGYWGEIWKYDGSGWAQEPSPTNVLLQAICCAAGDDAYIGGKCGVLIRGRSSRWQIVTNEATDQEFTSLAWFDSQLFLASPAGLFVLRDDEVQPVKFGAVGAATTMKLCVSDGFLWSIGLKDLLRYDGRRWSRVA